MSKQQQPTAVNEQLLPPQLQQQQQRASTTDWTTTNSKTPTTTTTITEPFTKRFTMNRTASEMAHVCEGQGEQVFQQFCHPFFETLDSIIFHPDNNNKNGGSRDKVAVAHVVQIGAHTAFEGNDLLSVGMKRYIELLPPKLRKERLHWTFVEPSPPNYQRLVQNLASHSSELCGTSAIQVGVIPEGNTRDNQQQATTVSTMTFYSIDSSIDPETGYDSKSGKIFPEWTTQISSFSWETMRRHEGAWINLGLKMEDYVVQVNVTTKGYSDLMQEIIGGDDTAVFSGVRGGVATSPPPPPPPVLVLIDTEGFDCDIVRSIPPTSPYLPQFLIFEQIHCRDKLPDTCAHMKRMGYSWTLTNENAFLIRNKNT
jgi:hypothetical protein